MRNGGSARGVREIEERVSRGGHVLASGLDDAFDGHRLRKASSLWIRGLDTFWRPGLIEAGLIEPFEVLVLFHVFG